MAGSVDVPLLEDRPSLRVVVDGPRVTSPPKQSHESLLTSRDFGTAFCYPIVRALQLSRERLIPEE